MQIEPEIARGSETTGPAAFVGVYIFTSNVTGWSFTEAKDFYMLGTWAPDVALVHFRPVYLFLQVLYQPLTASFLPPVVICLNNNNNKFLE